MVTGEEFRAPFSTIITQIQHAYHWRTIVGSIQHDGLVGQTLDVRQAICQVY
jgi:hypothetical protein